MIEKIDLEFCSFCSTCIDMCPMDVLRMDEQMGFPVIRYPEDCMTCYNCELNCPEGCIEVDPFREPIPDIIRY